MKIHRLLVLSILLSTFVAAGCPAYPKGCPTCKFTARTFHAELDGSVSALRPVRLELQVESTGSAPRAVSYQFPAGSELTTRDPRAYEVPSDLVPEGSRVTRARVVLQTREGDAGWSPEVEYKIPVQ